MHCRIERPFIITRQGVVFILFKLAALSQAAPILKHEPESRRHWSPESPF